MSDELFDPWALETGLLNDVDFTIESASFGYNANYNNGESLVLKLTGTAKAEDGSITADAELLYPVGKEWEAVDGGRTASHPARGTNKGFNNSSGIGLLITAAIESGAMDEFKRRATKPHQADTWEGLSFHMAQKEKDYGGEIGKKSRLLPTKFLGVGVSSNGSNGSPAASAAPAVAASGSGSSGISKVLEIKLKKLAGECSDHDEFIARAFEIDGVDGNPAAEEAVADDTRIWAEVKGA